MYCNSHGSKLDSWHRFLKWRLRIWFELQKQLGQGFQPCNWSLDACTIVDFSMIRILKCNFDCELVTREHLLIQ